MVVNLATKDYFKIKGTLTPAMIMQIYNNNVAQIEKQFIARINSAPKMFLGANIILDLSLLNGDNFDLGAIKATFQKYKINLIGVKSSNENIQKIAESCDIHIMQNTKPQSVKDKEQKIKTIVHRKPVRSGQQVFADKSELVVIGNVSAGAEIIASGSIHVYGTLRGKAIAGANGNTDAKIFAKEFAAELVAIAGVYKTFENSIYQNTVMISLEDNIIQCDEIT